MANHDINDKTNGEYSSCGPEKQQWTKETGAEVILGTHELEARHSLRKPADFKDAEKWTVSKRKENGTPVFPLEIFFSIIDHLRNEPGCLQTLIDTSNIWRSHCEYHLYSSAIFAASDESGFDAQCPCPQLVRNLQLLAEQDPNSDWVSPIVERIGEFQNLRFLELTEFFWEDFSEPENPCNTFLSSPVMHQVKELFLGGFVAEDFRAIARIISAFSALKTLSICMDDVDPGSVVFEPHDLPPPPTGLSELNVLAGGGCNQMASFWAWLSADTERLAGLRTIDLAGMCLNDLPFFGACMAVAGHTLTHLTFEFQSVDYAVAFAQSRTLMHTKNLMHLEISQCEIRSWSIDLLEGLFGSVSLPHLKTLILPHNAILEGQDEVQARETMITKGILEERRFPMLKELTWKSVNGSS